MPNRKFEVICDPERCPLPEALEAARRMAAAETAFDTRITQALSLQWVAHQPDLAVVERLLDLLAEIAQPIRLFQALRSALSHADPHIRSKSALLLGRKVENPDVLTQLVKDEDARVRANTVQALWGRTTDGARAIFDVALQDLHHRVAANAAYGLFLLDPPGHPVRLVRFIRHPHPRFRRAGAWILKKIGDPANLRLLQPLVTDKNAEVRTSAFNALVALRREAAQQGVAVEDVSPEPVN